METHQSSILATKGKVAPVDKHTLMLLDFEKGTEDSVTGESPIGESKSMAMTRIESTVEFYGVDYSRLSNCSVECWVKVAGNNYWMLMQGNTNAKYIMASSTANLYQNGSGDGIKNYINGVLGAALKRDGSWNHYVATGVNMSTWNRIRMGEYNNFQTFGNLFGLKIWDRELSASEVMAAKNGQLEDRPLHYWRLSDTENGVVPDTIGGADGIANNVSIEEGMSVYTKEYVMGAEGNRKDVISIDASTINMIPIESSDFTSGWSDFDGALIEREQGVFVPEWNTYDATRLKVTGGNNKIKSHIQLLTQSQINKGRVFTGQIKIKNIGQSPVMIHSNRISPIVQKTFAPGEIGTFEWTTDIHEDGVGGNLQIQLRAVDGDDIDFISYQPQIEERTYRTSYTLTERPEGQLAYPNPLNKSNALTVSCWAYFRGPSILQERLVTFREDINIESPLFITRRVGNLDVYGKTPAGTYGFRLTGPAVENNTWHHIVVTVLDGTATLYVNNEKIGSADIDVSEIPQCGSVNIGSEHHLFDGFRPLNGLIDEVRIDDVVRTEAEIQAWYYQGRNRGGNHT